MKNLALLSLLVGLVWISPAQAQITETNYLRVDSLLWVQFQQDADALYAHEEQMPDKVDSLQTAYDRLLKIVSRRNIELAIEYATVPSGLKRLYMVRLDLPKDSLAVILDRLPAAMRDSEDGRAIRQHILLHQLVEGDRVAPFACVTDRGEPFDWSVFEGRRVLFLYGGMGCMGSSGRDYLAGLYAKIPREKFRIVVYWPVGSPEALREMRTNYPCDYEFVSDFRQDSSPMKIQYGTQAMPTCFLTDPGGVIRVKSVALSPERFEAELAGILTHDNDAE